MAFRRMGGGVVQLTPSTLIYCVCEQTGKHISISSSLESHKRIVYTMLVTERSAALTDVGGKC